MALEWKECYINIPLNDTGIEEHERFDVEMSNVFSVALSWNDYNELNSVFALWNHRFHIIIDIFEEEVMDSDDVEEAMKILDDYIIAHPSAASKGSIEKLKSAIAKAIELKMPVFFDF